MNANDNMMDTHYQQKGRMHTSPDPSLPLVPELEIGSQIHLTVLPDLMIF